MIITKVTKAATGVTIPTGTVLVDATVDGRAEFKVTADISSKLAIRLVATDSAAALVFLSDDLLWGWFNSGSFEYLAFPALEETTGPHARLALVTLEPLVSGGAAGITISASVEVT